MVMQNIYALYSVQTNGPDNFTDFAKAYLRIMEPPDIILNISAVNTHRDNVVYIEGVTSNAYPGTAISWSVSGRTLLETPTGNCSQDNDPTYVCPEFSSIVSSLRCVEPVFIVIPIEMFFFLKSNLN